MDAREHFSGKRITVMGLGLLGRGAGDAKFLAECGAELIVTDLKPEAELAPSLELLSGFPNVSYALGGHRMEDFRGRDFILMAAGVPLDSPYVAEARANGIPVKMSASWFAELSDAPVIGVTGTRGKSTVTHMLHAILKEAGQEVMLGGNVRGVSTLALLGEAKPGAVALMELDSWQLQGFGEAGISPEVAVFTTFYPDHQNYYPGMDAYLADKANIFLRQGPADTLVLGEQCAELVQEKYGGRIEAHLVVAGAHDLRADWTLRVPGEHNRYDAALAVEAARAMDIPDDAIKAALEQFAGVPGRLELVKEADGVRFYNDTTATTPEATLAALDALRHEGLGIVLIMGGADKGLDMNRLLLEARKQAKRVIMLAGSGTSRVLEFLPEASVYDDLRAAVEEAARAAAPGDAVLFSPAFASFGMFKNEYDRGDRYDEIVRSLP